MASTQRPTRRRSARNAFDEEETSAPKRTKLDEGVTTNGTSKTATKSNGASKKKAKAAYEENDDGFQFARRTRSRKAQHEEPAATELRPVEPKAAPAPSSRRKKVTKPASEPPIDEPEPKRRRSARLSGDKELAMAAPEKKKRSRKMVEAPVQEEEDPVQLVAKTPVKIQERQKETKIALPFADTPVIRRNKEMRRGGNGSRRSSTGMRGRRASSLIETGTSNALPHSEVQPSDFYKHIEQSLLETRRMKQLLTWCGTRALPEKPSGGGKDTGAIMAARAIQQELLDDFASNSEMSDWFSREDTAPKILVKKPNPRNLENATRLAELEKEIKRLQEEKRAWQTLKKSTRALDSSKPKVPPDPAPLINPTILDDQHQISFLSTLSSTTSAASPSSQTPTNHAQIRSRVQHITASLEPTIDLFAHGIHKIAQYRLSAERVADHVLSSAADRLEERDKSAKEQSGTAGVGMTEVLGALGSILNGNSVR